MLHSRPAEHAAPNGAETFFGGLRAINISLLTERKSPAMVHIDFAPTIRSENPAPTIERFYVFPHRVRFRLSRRCALTVRTSIRSNHREVYVFPHRVRFRPSRR